MVRVICQYPCRYRNGVPANNGLYLLPQKSSIMLFLTNFLYSPSSAVHCSDEPVPHSGGAGVLHQGGDHFQCEASSTEDKAG